MMKLRALVAGIGSFLLAGSIHAAPIYYIYDLGALGGGVSGGFSRPSAIDEGGDVVGGTGHGDQMAFLFSGGQLTLLPPTGIPWSNAYDISDSGRIAGMAWVGVGASGPLRNAVIWDSSTTMTPIGPASGVRDEAAFGINNHGQAVGRTTLPDDSERAFVYSNGVMTALGTLGGDHSSASAINDTGQTVGFAYTATNTDDTAHAFLYENGLMTDLGTLGGDFSAATDINELGQILGVSSTSDGFVHTFLYKNGLMTDVGIPSGYSDIEGRALNNAGDIVGFFPHENRAFLYSAGVFYDINTLIDSPSDWTIIDAADINESGQIAAVGVHPIYAPFGHAVRLDLTPLPPCCAPPTPVPEPTTLLLAALGLAGIGWSRRREG